MSDQPIWMPAADAIANGCLTGLNVPGVMSDALAEIARLTAEVERMRPVVDAARAVLVPGAWMERERKLADLRDALRALDGEP